MGRLSNKVAIVTGAGGGIGKSAALLFASEGAAVVAGVHQGKDIAALEQAALGLAGSVSGLEVDVAREEDVRRLIDMAVGRFGGIDILFNNAGIEIQGEVTETTDEMWFRVLDINLRGVFLCSKHVVPEMLKRGGGSIVNNASINGIRGNHRLVAYSASKGGVVALTRAMAIDYAPRGIRVNCVCPATIDTPMVQRSIASAPYPEERHQYMVSKHPMGRIGTPDEVAYAALFLASDEASFITGVALPIDGGRHIR
jgi:NAD(P)-dependent dehydrogenase (short-subunit alcohol dehydrogenase family)